ncbi:hypothetical protein PMIN06_002344 [Paraphaeosphaeria minitans]
MMTHQLHRGEAEGTSGASLPSNHLPAASARTPQAHALTILCGSPSICTVQSENVHDGLDVRRLSISLYYPPPTTCNVFPHAHVRTAARGSDCGHHLVIVGGN